MNVQPASPLERVLTQFWDDALGRNDSDRLTDFFAAGAQGMEAERLLSMIEDAFHVEMPLAVLQEAPTVKAFAEAMKHQVDHPGRLERLAERLLQDGHSATASQRGGQGAGASW
jgi:phosphopantetheine binding protein